MVIATSLRSAVRNVKKNKLIFLMTEIGLIIGFTTFLFIGSFISYELEHDALWANRKFVYRANKNVMVGNEIKRIALTSKAVEEQAQKMAEVGSVTRLLQPQSDLVFNVQNNFFIEKNCFYADANFFRVFDLKLLHGDRTTILKGPNSIIISARSALRFFGTTDALGNSIVLKNKFGERQLEVEGVFDDIPTNSHLQLNCILSGMAEPVWNMDFPVFYTYIKVKPETDIVKLVERFNTDLQKISKQRSELELVSLASLYFDHAFVFDVTKKGNIDVIKILFYSSVGLLFITLINFVVLNVVFYLKRIKEFGIKQVLGATSSSLRIQIFAETLLMALCALSVSFLVFFLITKQGSILRVSPFTFTSLSMKPVTEISIFFAIFSCVITVFIVHGLIVFANVNVKVITFSKPALNVGSALLFVQMTASVSIVLLATVFFRQSSYLVTKDIGFNQENIMVLRPPQFLETNDWRRFKLRLIALRGIKSVSESTDNIVNPTNRSTLSFGNSVKDRDIEVYYNVVDSGFFNALGIPLLKGDLLSRKQLIINEAAMAIFPTDALSNKVYFSSLDSLTEVGTISRNFHFQNFKIPIAPMVFSIANDEIAGILYVQATDHFDEQLMSKIKTIWNEEGMSWDFQYTWLEDEVAQLYTDEKILSKASISFGLLALVVTLIGLLSLVSFYMERNKKNNYLKIILGASEPMIIKECIQNYLIMYLIASLVASVFAYFIAVAWLESFAYKVYLHPLLFIIPIIIIFILVVLFTSGYSIYLVRKNAVHTLSE